jgi:ABC-type transport system involved in cytochrome bd biosynthesis fused ATPase/permease subunit
MSEGYESDHSSDGSTKSSSHKLQSIVKSKEFEDFVHKSKHIQRGGHKIEQAFELCNVKNPLTFSYSNLNLYPKRNPEKKILTDLFGVVYPFNVTAIVGTSGCGEYYLFSRVVP